MSDMKKQKWFKLFLASIAIIASVLVTGNHVSAEEKGESRENAIIYSIESSTSGVVKSDESKFYKFTLDKNSTIDFRVETGSHYQELGIYILDQSGHQLLYYYTKDPNNWGKQIFSKNIAMASGEYYIKVINNWYDNGDVSYSIDTEIVAEDTDTVKLAGIGNEFLVSAHPFEPGNTLQSVTLYTYGKECHRYKYIVEKDQTILFRAKADLSKNQKLFFRMYDENGKKISVKPKSLKGYVWAADLKLKAGTYYFGIQANADEIPYTVYTVAVPGKVSGTKAVSSGKKQMKVTWKKNSIACKGYELQYCLRKSFKGSKVYKATVKKQSTTSWKKKGLHSKWKYYVRVRAYTEINGKKVYGSWGTVKSVKIK